MTKTEKESVLAQDFSRRLMAIEDTVVLLSGKWTVRILVFLFFETANFMELKRRLKGIGQKMLSQELRKLETHGLIKRSVLTEKPLTVSYELTPHGITLKALFEHMEAWGQLHRKSVTTSDEPSPLFRNRETDN